MVINIRNDSKKGNYSYKTQFVYSLLFNENKKVASPVTTPAPSEQVRVNLGNTTANSIPQNGEKSTSKTKYSKKEEYVYSIRFRDNKTVATSLFYPASSKATRKFDAATINSIPQISEKSTSKTKKDSESDGIVDRKSLDDDLFDKDRFFANAMENGGVISHEEAEAIRANSKPEPEKSQTAGKKPSEGRKQEHAAEVAEKKAKRLERAY